MGAPGWLTARPIAHRGLHNRSAGRVENTLAAAEAACQRNFAIECDIQLTADGEPVVFHDDTLERLTLAKGPVRARTLSELQSIRLRDTDERIPTLPELLDLVSDRVPLVIELKSDWKGDRLLEQRVTPILSGYRGRAVVMSFDPDSMKAMRRMAPAIPRGLVADHFDPGEDWGHLSAMRRFTLRHLLAAGSAGASFISYGIEALPAAAPILLHRLAGLTLITWTIRTRAEWDKARRYVDQITFEGFDPDAKGTAPASR